MEITRIPTTILRVECPRGPIQVFPLPSNPPWQTFVCKIPNARWTSIAYHPGEDRFPQGADELERIKRRCHPSDFEILTDLVRRYAELT